MRRFSLALVAAFAVGSFAPMVQAREATPAVPAPAPSAKGDPNRMIWVVVGDKSVVMPQLAKLGLPVEISPIANDSTGAPARAAQ